MEPKITTVFLCLYFLTTVTVSRVRADFLETEEFIPFESIEEQPTTKAPPPPPTLVELDYFHFTTNDELKNFTWLWQFPVSVNETIRNVSTLVRHYEYYNTSKQLQDGKSNPNHTCPYTLSKTVDDLPDVLGIWAACQDTELVESSSYTCGNFLPCYPSIKFGNNVFHYNFKTVNLTLALQGLATVRLHPSGDKCFDFSFRMDPFSPCQFVKVPKSDKLTWEEVQTAFDGYEPTTFSTFSIELIARFEDDVVLLDKIFATTDRLCGENECPTTSIGPTNPNPTVDPRPPTTEEPTPEEPSDDDFQDEPTTTMKPSKGSTLHSVGNVCLFLFLIACRPLGLKFLF